MRKLLVAGAIASVALSSANAECVNGGFYIQGSFGISMTKMKYKNNLEPQYRLLKKGETDKMEHFKVIPSNIVNNFGSQNATIVAITLNPGNYNAGNHNVVPGFEDCVWWDDARFFHAYTDATETSLRKRKGMFQFELGLGIDKRIGDAMIGIDVNFGKNFGNIKKKVKGLAYRKYADSDDVNDGLNPLANSNISAMANNHYGCLFISKATTDRYPDYAAGINAALDVGGPINANVLNAVLARTVLNVSVLNGLHLYDPDFALEFKCKNKFYISIMPRLGMLLNPRTEIYVTAGMKIKGDKYTVRDVEAKKSGSKSVTKCIPSFGLGLRHTFGNGVFLKLEYNMNLKASKTFKKLKFGDTVIDETTKHTFKNSSNDIKLGFGRKF